jgi:hypothetical protein
MPEKSFLELYRTGQVGAEEIKTYINRWRHLPGPFGPKLHDYLGLTWAQYKDWQYNGWLPLPTHCRCTRRVKVLWSYPLGPSSRPSVLVCRTGECGLNVPIPDSAITKV